MAGAYSAIGPPGEILERWREGEFELLVSEKLLAELERALGKSYIEKRVSADEARELVAALRSRARVLSDTEPIGVSSRDRNDDYLLGLAQSAAAVLVTGDNDLLALRDLPIMTPAEFLRHLT